MTETTETAAEPQGMGLSITEAHGLAWRMMAQLASDWAAHIDWEDVPELGEYAWEHVAEDMDEVALSIARRSQNFDRNFGIDSTFLLSIAQDGGR